MAQVSKILTIFEMAQVTNRFHLKAAYFMVAAFYGIICKPVTLRPASEIPAEALSLLP